MVRVRRGRRATLFRENAASDVKPGPVGAESARQPRQAGGLSLPQLRGSEQAAHSFRMVLVPPAGLPKLSAFQPSRLLARGFAPLSARAVSDVLAGLCLNSRSLPSSSAPLGNEMSEPCDSDKREGE